MSKKLSYAWYDFANSGFVIIFQSFLFPLYFVSLFENHIEGTAKWGLILFISNLVSILLSPLIGKIADTYNKFKIFLILILVTGFLATLSIIPQQIFLLSTAFIIYNITFELSQVIYDSFLYDISNKNEERTLISTFAWGFGYLGGLLFVIIYFLLNKLGLTYSSIIFVSALLYLVLSIYSYREISSKFTLSRSIQGLNISKIKFDKSLLSYLSVYFVIFLSISALLHFAPVYFKEVIGLSHNVIGGIVLVGQIIAFPLTIYAGKVANQYGLFRAIRYSLLIWSLGLLGMFLSESLIHVIITMLILSFVIGSTQSLLRSHYSTLLNSNINENYGLYGFINKAGYLVAPLIITFSSSILGNIRYAFIAIFLLLILGFILSTLIDE